MTASNRQLIIREISEDLNTFYGFPQSILTNLNMREVSAKLVLHLATVEQNQQCLSVSSEMGHPVSFRLQFLKKFYHRR